MPIELTKVESVHDGWGKFLIAHIRMADGQEFTREIEDHGNAVGVLAYDRERRTAVLVRQFRAPMFYATGLEHTLEVIAGGRAGDDPRECVRREALEEAGLRLRNLEHVLTGMSMPGVSTMCIDLYLAAYEKQDIVGLGGGLADEGEEVAVVELELADLARMIDAGLSFDLATAFLVQTLRIRHAELFEDASGRKGAD
jgi:nudix-type nucleoside diphosphatase (YffH/AdpP family)